jgi:colicin import membrane protein
LQLAARRDPGTAASAVLAVAVHAILFVVLFFGIRWRTKHPEPVMAELWSQLPAIEAPRPAPPPPPVIAPKPEPKAEPRPEPRPEPKAEPKPEPKPDIALEQEKKRKEEAERKRKEEAEQKRREEAEQKKREEALKAKAEAERKEKELAEQRRREDLEAERKRVQDQLARELAAAPKSAAPKAPAGVPGAAAEPSALVTWQRQIEAKVRSNIVLPPDLTGNPEAQFDVTLLPTGEVLSVKLVRSSGNRVLDDAWERAILKSSPLPKPARADLFRRDLRLVFRPRGE